jgi:hypothetical protein
MAIAHHLDLGKDSSMLATQLMQAERPLISHVATDSRSSVIPRRPGTARNPGEWPLQRNAEALSRHMRVSDAHQPSHSYDAIQWLMHHLPEKDTGEYVGAHGEYQNDKGLWTPHNFSKYKDVHEALQSHTSAEVPHDGVLHNDNEGSQQFKSVNQRMGIRPREMTPEEHSSFNDTEAFKYFANVKPFAGLLHVESFDPKTRGNYTYNPQTEELHQHDH